jgi:benzoate-CoA ligase family protein
MPHQTIFDYLAQHLRERPDAPVYLHRGGALSFRDFHGRAAKLGGALRSYGVKPGDRVALVMQDSPELAIALLAIMGIGGVAVPCNTALNASDLTHVLTQSGSRLVIISSEHVETVRSIRPGVPNLAKVLAHSAEKPADCLSFQEFLDSGNAVELGAEEGPAFLVYTSGSTGRPKGALHYHSDMVFIVEAIGRKVYEITPADRMFSASRMPFAYGFGNSFVFPIGFGAPCILLSERPTPAGIARIFDEFRPTIFFGVPAVFRSILEYRRQGGAFHAGNLKFSAAGGENLPPQTFNEWLELTGTPILETIGTTELLHGYISNKKTKIRPGSSGLCVDGYDIKLVDEAGNHDAARGVLFVKGGSAFRKYWDDPEKTAETIIDGWVRTGDIYRRDEEGFFFFEGRADDMFKSSGMWVSPVDVEDVLRTHPAVQEVAVVGMPAADGSFEVTAFVSLRPDFAVAVVIDELKAAAESSLPRYKRPKQLHVISELPRNPTGKVQRFKLRALSAENFSVRNSA